MCELLPEHGDSRHAGDALLDERAANVRRQHQALNDERAADENRCKELVQPVIETEREETYKYVVPGKVKIVSDDIGAGHQVSMAEHDPLGQPGGAGGINNEREVVSDHRGMTRAGLAGACP